MRETFRPGFILNGDTAVGFNFSNGGCAEHEWGIEILQKILGITPEISGIEGRKIRNKENIKFVKYKNKGLSQAFMCCDIYHDIIVPNNMTETKKNIKKLSYCLIIDNRYDKNKTEWISSCWDRSAFAICVAGDENVKNLEKVYEMTQNNDAMCLVGTQSNNPFERDSLVILQISSMSNEEIKEYYDYDEDMKALALAAKPILEKLNEAGCEYYACAPEWLDKEKGTLKFFLNPRNQKEFYWGWVTTEELLDWTQGRGTIVEKGKLREGKEYEEFEKARREMFN